MIPENEISIQQAILILTLTGAERLVLKMCLLKKKKKKTANSCKCSYKQVLYNSRYYSSKACNNLNFIVINI